MIMVTGNCSYKFDSPKNYILPYHLCRLENDTVIIEDKYCAYAKRHLNLTLVWQGTEYSRFKVEDILDKLKATAEKFEKPFRNAAGCDIKPNPRIFGFYAYHHCVSQLSSIAVFFPYLVLSLAFVLVILERILTRYMWTGRRIEKFYDLLVKDVLKDGDIEKMDTKENRQKCSQIHYDFKGSSFYSKAYVCQTAIKMTICLGIITWSILDMCNDLHKSFRTNFQCDIMDYCHECALPSNGMNVLVYNCVNVTLFCIFIVACCNFGWHLRFKSTKMFEISMSEIKRTNIFQRKVKLYYVNYIVIKTSTFAI